MPKEALYYEKKKNKIVQCHLCPRNCVIKPNEYGNCNARKNIKGKLYSMVYARPVAIAVDPIEKKPLFHFMPGEPVFSIKSGNEKYVKIQKMDENLWRIPTLYIDPFIRLLFKYLPAYYISPEEKEKVKCGR